MFAQVTSITEELPLGLTEYAVNYPTLVRKARELVSDRPDLHAVRKRMMEKHEMSRQQVETAEIHFSRFALLVDVADGPISPSKLADDYWHEFLMFTRLYRQWCEKHFGAVLDHHPGVKSGAKDRVKQLNELFFGETFADQARCCCRCCY